MYNIFWKLIVEHRLNYHKQISIPTITNIIQDTTEDATPFLFDNTIRRTMIRISWSHIQALKSLLTPIIIPDVFTALLPPKEKQ